jgi:hypothetical protein
MVNVCCLMDECDRISLQHNHEATLHDIFSQAVQIAFWQEIQKSLHHHQHSIFLMDEDASILTAIQNRFKCTLESFFRVFPYQTIDLS